MPIVASDSCPSQLLLSSLFVLYMNVFVGLAFNALFPSSICLFIGLTYIFPANSIDILTSLYISNSIAYTFVANTKYIVYTKQFTHESQTVQFVQSLTVSGIQREKMQYEFFASFGTFNIAYVERLVSDEFISNLLLSC